MKETGSKNEAKFEVHEDHAFLEKVTTSIENLKTMKITLGKDIYNVVMLIYLYFLQGIPLGLAASMPFMLSSRNVSYADQGKFSFVFWPFSLKLLWAPIVDTIFIKRVGRRKTWLIPVQFFMGIFMISFANIVQSILSDIKSQQG
jgi:PAT family acetyl-CoA transporter-like MFS transporter 1